MMAIFNNFQHGVKVNTVQEWEIREVFLDVSPELKIRTIAVHIKTDKGILQFLLSGDQPQSWLEALQCAIHGDPNFIVIQPEQPKKKKRK